MHLRMYSIFDNKAEAYNTPFFQRTHGEAIRSFETACADPQTDFFKHAGDYALFFIGSFDASSGVVQPEALPSLLANGHEVLSRLQSKTL